MRRLCATLTSSLDVGRDLDAPVDPHTLLRRLCDAMSATRGGRPIVLRFERFPTQLTTSGLWLNMEDYDIVVVEKFTTPDHQLVILGHELWHMQAGHTAAPHGPGAAAAAQSLPDGPDLTYAAVAARSHHEDAHEIEAETFGLLLGDRCRAWLSGGDGAPGSVRRHGVAGRIGNTLGYRGPNG
ncbi:MULTISPECIES: toxin-antitoxin system, toxin component [unclassified Streptomyces]|uniref:toxin-antitoxin system, toxin component n=1 Tax=unclassified Streptomyces TaxID=2593676 RepID=UPI00224E5F86|nr:MULTISPECIES: toxin-antitoxin system, toxin component [unclassified Streptomyces]MCX4524342.1 toxin-antitoxin system, toxin component [Streptomyces sp. NBC_01551]MCX4545137.1 toxin-antitoxin system, toxin component [Streptomyces sp. NBC_01565]